MSVFIMFMAIYGHDVEDSDVSVFIMFMAIYGHCVEDTVM